MLAEMDTIRSTAGFLPRLSVVHPLLPFVLAGGTRMTASALLAAAVPLVLERGLRIAAAALFAAAIPLVPAVTVFAAGFSVAAASVESPAPASGAAPRDAAAAGAPSAPPAGTEGRAAPGRTAASRLTAEFRLSDVSESPESVLLTFSFTLHNPGPDPVAFDKVVLANLADADSPWAGFEGGTVPAKGSVDRVAGVTVSPGEYRRWQSGSHPALFVYTHSAEKDLIRTRIRALPAPR